MIQPNKTSDTLVSYDHFKTRLAKTGVQARSTSQLSHLYSLQPIEGQSQFRRSLKMTDPACGCKVLQGI